MRILGVLCLAFAILSAKTSIAQDPIAIATTGITAGAFLDKLSDKANNVVQNAGAVGSLLTSKAARDIQLEIMAARMQLGDEANSMIDRLDQEKVSCLTEMDKSLNALSKQVQTVSTMQDDLILDIDSTLNGVPFLKTAKTIRRIWGASQYYKPNGIYIITLHGNIFDSDSGNPVVSIAGRPLTTPPMVTPPYDVRLEIPASLINDQFKDRRVVQIPVSIKQRVSGRDYSFQIWRNEYRTQEYNFVLELFPRYPAAYRLTEYDEQPSVNDTQVNIWPGTDTLIPGCGDSGCSKYYSICEDVPPGGKPIRVDNFRDSFQGWGGWSNPMANASGICATYWQHSHNTARNVGFSVAYNPPTKVTVPKDVEFMPTDSGDLGAYFNKPDVDDVSQAKDHQLAVPKPPDSGQSIAEKGIDHGAVRIGETYDVHFSDSMKSYTLVMRMFTGQEIVVTPGRASDLLDQSQLENTSSFKRMTIGLKPPW